MSATDTGELPDPTYTDGCDMRISARVGSEHVEEVDDLVEEGLFRNRSHAIRHTLARTIEEHGDTTTDDDSANDNASDNADTEAR